MAELTVFFSAFLAGSILPASSESVLLYYLAQGHSYWWMIGLATLGNSLGGATVYGLGLLGDFGKIERYLGVKEEKAQKFKDRLRPFGYGLAFFSFLPWVGDIVLLACGLTRAAALPVMILMIVGKFLRYIVVASYLPEVEQITRSIFDFLT